MSVNNRTAALLLSALTAVAGFFLLRIDYAFLNFGRPRFGGTYIGGVVKVLYLAVGFIGLGCAGVMGWFSVLMRRS